MIEKELEVDMYHEEDGPLALERSSIYQNRFNKPNGRGLASHPEYSAINTKHAGACNVFAFYDIKTKTGDIVHTPFIESEEIEQIILNLIEGGVNPQNLKVYVRGDAMPLEEDLFFFQDHNEYKHQKEESRNEQIEMLKKYLPEENIDVKWTPDGKSIDFDMELETGKISVKLFDNYNELEDKCFN